MATPVSTQLSCRCISPPFEAGDSKVVFALIDQ